MVNPAEQKVNPRIAGLTLHAAAAYDLQIWLFTLGRERAFREKMLCLARLQPGEAVLDVGCGTGTLAILAARQVGPTGAAFGIDTSPEMIARATHKAARDGARVTFKVAPAQELPFSDRQLDVVLTTLMLHHLPRPSRQQLAREIRRVLKPGGRALAVDFGEEGNERKGLVDHLHHRRHGHTKVRDIVGVLGEAGLRIDQSGPVGTKNLHFVLATAASNGDAPARGDEDSGHALPETNYDKDETPQSNPKPKAYLFGFGIVLVVVLAVLLHVGVAASLLSAGTGSPPLSTVGFLGLAGIALLMFALKVKFLLGRHLKRRG